MKTLKGICFASCLALLLALPVASYASEKTYQVTETELGKLEDNLNQLQKVNEEQKKNSETLKTELTASQSKLKKAETESVRLSEQLTGLKKTAIEQEALLEKANQSLAEYAKEEKKEKERLRLQRDLGWGVAILAAAAYIKK
ncbi:hypothetical protein [uncultured Dialister sp.]|uniref:hypothetical protein n=1 Tax=uncultured Dialister sp. TaxID=278064 RepID=UPI00265E1323|nr:hypothetical protein [uncultured Dialister sp.]